MIFTFVNHKCHQVTGQGYI